MNNTNKPEWVDGFIEQGAALEHARWARWQEHMFDCAIKSGDDNVGIRTLGYRTSQYEGWERQIETPYAELSEAEKESDRREVREYLPLIEQLIALAEERGRGAAVDYIEQNSAVIPLPSVLEEARKPGV